MRLPRRVPWASLAELEQVCTWIYTDEEDMETKVLAIQRISAWRVITTIPHALESTLSILAVIVQDSTAQSPALLLRHAYAAAIIRLVNGLVDPLQLGVYARPIASIAAQLDLPPWLVELRHAATHEDLPSIEVLRTAASTAMRWLLTHYFIPALNSSAPPPSKASTLRPLSPVLQEYKALLKIVTRDASLRTKYKPEITRVLRDLERWISEAKVAADITAATLDWDDLPDDGADKVDSRERWALDKFAEGLVDKGGLVPLSKKKRGVVTTTFHPAPAIIALWEPLIAHLSSLHPSFISTLTSRIIANLLTKADEKQPEQDSETILLEVEAPSRDLSYDMCLASWANWLITFSNSSSAAEDDRDARKEDAMIALLTGMCPLQDAPSNDGTAARRLLEELSASDPGLRDIVDTLQASPPPSSASWQEHDLDSMSKRLESLIALQTPESNDEERSLDTTANPDRSERELPAGWRLLSARDGWRPTPIGVSPWPMVTSA